MSFETVVEIGRWPVLLRLQDPDLQAFIHERYGGFITTQPSSKPVELTVEVDPGAMSLPLAEPHVECSQGRWVFAYDDFRAEWLPGEGHGLVKKGTAPASMEAVLRILYSIIAGSDGACLFHASSAIRNGKAFMFPGVSGAGKTTISGLRPPDATLLTDEISFIRPSNEGYEAFGTPFAGALRRPGDNVSAPLAAVYLLAQGPVNKIEALPPRDAIARLMRHVLFAGKVSGLAESLLDTACRIVDRVPVRRLTFAPTPAVWELIG